MFHGPSYNIYTSSVHVRWNTPFSSIWKLNSTVTISCKSSSMLRYVLASFLPSAHSPRFTKQRCRLQNVSQVYTGRMAGSHQVLSWHTDMHTHTTPLPPDDTWRCYGFWHGTSACTYLNAQHMVWQHHTPTVTYITASKTEPLLRAVLNLLN